MVETAALEQVRTAFTKQAEYCRAGGAPLTAGVVEAILAGLDGPGEFRSRLRGWSGSAGEDALALRAAAGVHYLYRSGAAPELVPVYAGETTDAVATINRAINRHDAALLPWLDGPPQTNEVGRSALYIAALIWLAGQGLPARWQGIEIGSSAGANLMMDRYGFDLDGVEVGPADARLVLRPEWRGRPAPRLPAGADWQFVDLAGCDVAPVDLSDPDAVLRLSAYIWADHPQRFQRLALAAESAQARRPDLVQADAADFVEAKLREPQRDGVTRVLLHSLVWQYLDRSTQQRIEAAMAEAASTASDARPLAWIGVETNEAARRQELVVRYWPGGEEPVMLAQVHPHGAWIDWLI